MNDVQPKDIKHSIKNKKDYIPKNYQNKGHEHGSHHGENSFSSERIVNYKGKKVVIETTYKVEIDGVPLKAHVSVSDDGTVHCHGLPNYSFASATSLVKNLIDAEGLAKVEKNELSAPCDGGNDNHHDHH